MELSAQVCSLELAKKLKELGVKQDSLWHWCDTENGFKVIIRNEAPGYYEFASAFTVAELGEIIPPKYLPSRPDLGMQWPVNIILSGARWTAMEKTEANARATTLVYLIEKWIVKP